MASKSRLATVDTITTEQLLQVVSQSRRISGASSDPDGDIRFYFRDQDGDRLAVIVSVLDEQRLACATLIKLPQDNIFATLAAVNAWNGRRDSHSTFSYMLTSNDITFAGLETHLALDGGVTTNHIVLWVENLIEHINHWESILLEAWREVPTDSEIENGGGGLGGDRGLGRELIDMGLNLLPYLVS